MPEKRPPPRYCMATEDANDGLWPAPNARGAGKAAAKREM